MKNILFILSSWLLFQNSYAQTKNVYWVHGMSGHSESLELYADKYYSERQMYCLRPEAYPTNIGVTGAALELEAQIIANPANIIIAHSMGGLNSRQLHKNTYGQAFGGLITLGTPHSGAIVADNIDNGVLDNFIADGANKGLRGIKSDPVLSNLNVVTYFSFQIVSAIGDIWGENIPSSLYDLMAYLPEDLIRKSAEKALGSDITKNELKTNSQLIAQLKQYGPDMPTIAIYGVEDSPAFLRFAGARKNNESKKPLHQINDNGSVDLVNSLANLCNIMNEACWAISDASILWNWPAHFYYKWAAGEWQVSADFYGGQLQTGCDFLIGAKRNGYQEITYEDWVCDNDEPTEMKGRLKKLACRWPDDYYPVTKTAMVPVIISTPSDGLLPIDTEMALPGCDPNNKYEALHVNHEELKNHVSVTTILTKIFNGDIADQRNPSFFYAAPR